MTGFRAHQAALRAGRLLHVVNYHVTLAADAGRLADELGACLERFDPVTPAHLDAYFGTGRWPLPRPGFVAAFYDGYREHATVAAPVCERLGVTAWFLPPTGFLDAAPAEQAAWAEAHDLWPHPDPPPDGRIALTWDELAALGERHVVAAHTHSHTGPESAAGPEGAEREIAGPARAIAEATGRRPAAVAWGGGLPADRSGPALAALRAAGHRYVVSATAVQRIR